MSKLYEYDAAPEHQSSAGAILRRIPSGSHVLEIGCSVGSQTKIMKNELGCQVTAIEIDATAAERAAQYCHKIIVGNIEQMSEGELEALGHFDVVTFSDVLEHLRDPSLALKKVAPLLKPGGILLATVPNITHAALAFELLHGRFEYRDYGLLDSTHIRFFDRQGILRTFEKAGYFVLQIERITCHPKDTEFSTRPISELDETVLAYISANNPDHDTYQFLIHATPSGSQDQGISALEAARQIISQLETEISTAHSTIKKLKADKSWEQSGAINRIRHFIFGK